MKELNLNQLENINGGDNFTDCAASLGAVGGVLMATTGPIGVTAYVAGLGISALAAGAASGWSCTKLYYEGLK